MRVPVFATIMLISLFFTNHSLTAQIIPLPEHPRPDFMRDDWQNLNGIWGFKFDPYDQGKEEGWQREDIMFDLPIYVPFPWGSPMSRVRDEADIGWYHREITVDPSWEGKRIFLTIGASDWETEVWVNDQYLGKHQGGYVPFSFELTGFIKFGEPQHLVIRADDARREFTLYGKQGYGNARGIWQTVYLEARGEVYLDALHFAPDIDLGKVSVTAYLPEASAETVELELMIKTPFAPITTSQVIPAGEKQVTFDVPVDNARLWNLEDPYLYEVEANLGDDKVHTYFGMRKISVRKLPGTDIPYIALNNEPVYLQMALDQSYHPEGYYTFPDDEFMKAEILRSKSIGLNGIRTHIKVEIPRKLYWADKLGLLVMEDLPNSWGEPTQKMQEESEYTMREMIRRDYNHPSVFSWVLFNETWGLFTNTGKDEQGNNTRKYLPKTQDWVASMYYLAKSLDQTRLVEDNSICCGRGHTETDINSWHHYLPGWEWDDYLMELTEKSFEGSTYHFEEGFEQENQPVINSECGNVWGYEGSTGDVDWSWDYHRMINSFRMFPNVAGWLYTEHHDVINEWNGYWRFDRSEKFTGLGEMVEGMDLNDFHSKVYLSPGNEICRTVGGGEEVDVPLMLSVMTGENFGDQLTISWALEHTNRAAETSAAGSGTFSIPYKPWMQEKLDALKLKMPGEGGLAILRLRVTDREGNVLHRNFMHFEVEADLELPDAKVFSVPAERFSGADWSLQQWEVLDGKKVNGAGEGYFRYAIPVPEGTSLKRLRKATFMVELSAKEFFVKDQRAYNTNQDFMRGSKVAPSANPNSYPMTDETEFPSEITISLNGKEIHTELLPDDPADHRGVLSWHHQLQDRRLREAGSYGYMVKVSVGKRMLRKAMETGELEVELKTNGDGGIAVYGKEFGRYPVDPSLVLKYR